MDASLRSGVMAQKQAANSAFSLPCIVPVAETHQPDMERQPTELSFSQRFRCRSRRSVYTFSGFLVLFAGVVTAVVVAFKK